jgi:hypothetical protein
MNTSRSKLVIRKTLKESKEIINLQFVQRLSSYFLV